MLVARILGERDFGTYTFLAAVGTILIAGASGGIPVFLLREVASGRGTAEANARLLVLLSLLAAAGSVLALGVMRVAAPGGQVSIPTSLVAVIAFNLLALPPFFSALRTGQRQVGRAALGEALVGVVAVTATWIALASGTGLNGALAAIGIAALCGTLSLVQRLPLRRAVDGLWPLARSTGPFIALGLVNSGYLRVDALAVSAFGSVRALALYSAAYRLLGATSLLTSAFGTVFFSKLSAESPGTTSWSELRRRGAVALLASVAVLTAVSVWAAPFIIRVLYGSPFDDAVVPAQILLLSGIPLALYWPTAHALNATSGEKYWLKILVLALTMDFALVASTVGIGGATAAALCWCLTETLILVLATLALRHHLKLRCPPRAYERRRHACPSSSTRSR